MVDCLLEQDRVVQPAGRALSRKKQPARQGEASNHLMCIGDTLQRIDRPRLTRGQRRELKSYFDNLQNERPMPDNPIQEEWREQERGNN